MRQGARKMAPRADKAGDRELVFRACVLAADSAYFALELAGKAEEQWHLTVLSDLLICFENRQDAFGSDVWDTRLVSLLSALLSEIMSKLFVENDRKESYLRMLAQKVDAQIPLDFVFPADPPKTVRAALTLSGLSYTHGDAKSAHQRLSIAMEAAERQGARDAWLAMAETTYSGDRRSNAPGPEQVELRRRLRERCEESRARFLSRAGRLHAAQDLSPILGEMLRDEVSDGGFSSSEVFDAVEAMKARMLLDQLEVEFCTPGPGALAMQVGAMEREVLSFPQPDGEARLVTNELSLLSLLPVARVSAAGGDEEKYRALKEIEALYAGHEFGFRGAGRTAELKDVMSALNSDEALIEYCIPHRPLHPARELVIVVVTRSTAEVVYVPLDDLAQYIPSASLIGRISVDGQAPIDSSPLGDLVVNVRTSIQNADDRAADAALQVLHQHLIQPIESAGFGPQKFRRWIVIAHGMLHAVPFGALLNAEGGRLIEAVSLTMAPSASVWLRQSSRGRPAANSFLGFANPHLSDDEAEALPGAEEEVKEIRAVLSSLSGPSPFVGASATMSEFRDEAPGKSIIHLATHGEYPEIDAIDFHSILLAAGTGDDGRLSADVIRQLDLRACRLVALSICDGGLYRFGPGDEPYGLVPAFIAAGAENVLGTLWPIGDEFARPYMVAFYRHLVVLGPADALQKVSLEQIRAGASLRDWAAFVVTGPGRAIA